MIMIEMKKHMFYGQKMCFTYAWVCDHNVCSSWEDHWMMTPRLRCPWACRKQAMAMNDGMCWFMGGKKKKLHLGVLKFGLLWERISVNNRFSVLVPAMLVLAKRKCMWVHKQTHPRTCPSMWYNMNTYTHVSVHLFVTHTYTHTHELLILQLPAHLTAFEWPVPYPPIL